jgi:MFS family permease
VNGNLPADFHRLWLGYILAQVATRSATFVFPILAVLQFNASSTEVGLVNATLFAPTFLFTLAAGAWLDGRARRPSLLFAHVVRGALTLLVPLLGLLGGIGVGGLMVIAFAVGVMNALADVTTPTYVPSLVGADGLVPANSRLEATNALTQVAAPGLGGLLMGWVGGFPAMAIFGVAYLSAAGLTLLIRHHEPSYQAATPRANPWRRIVEGLRISAGIPLIRLLAVQAAWFNLFEQAILTIFLVYAVRTLGFGAPLLGFSMAIGALGAVVGSLTAHRLASTMGVRSVLFIGINVASVATVLIPAASGPRWSLVLLISISFILYGYGLTVFNIFSVSLRQRLVPEAVLGRVVATFRFLAFGTIWIGALVGGVTADLLGSRPALVGMVCALICGCLCFGTMITRSIQASPEIRDHIDSLQRNRERV